MNLSAALYALGPLAVVAAGTIYGAICLLTSARRDERGVENTNWDTVRIPVAVARRSVVAAPARPARSRRRGLPVAMLLFGLFVFVSAAGAFAALVLQGGLR